MENLGFGYNLEIYNSEIKYDGKDYKLPLVCSAYDDRDRLYTTRHSAILIDASILDMSLYHDDYIAYGEPLLLNTLYESGYNGMFRTGIISDKVVIEDRLAKAGVAFCDGSNELTRKWNSSFYLKVFVPDVDYSKVTIYKGVPSAYAVCDCIEHYAIAHKLSIKKCAYCGKPFLATHGNGKFCSRIGFDDEYPDESCKVAFQNKKSKLRKRCDSLIEKYGKKANDFFVDENTASTMARKRELHKIACEYADLQFRVEELRDKYLNNNPDPFDLEWLEFELDYRYSDFSMKGESKENIILKEV